jgi:hypothetical protein
MQNEEVLTLSTEVEVEALSVVATALVSSAKPYWLNKQTTKIAMTCTNFFI